MRAGDAAGVGKSTLLKVIFSELAPQRGYVTRHNGLRVERFTQHHVDQLNMKKSPLEMFRAEWPADPVQKVRAHLGSMGITGKLALQPIYTVRGLVCCFGGRSRPVPTTAAVCVCACARLRPSRS